MQTNSLETSIPLDLIGKLATLDPANGMKIISHILTLRHLKTIYVENQNVLMSRSAARALLASTIAIERYTNRTDAAVETGAAQVTLAAVATCSQS